MPRKPIDYSNTHFYKIVCKDTSIKECYIGHTTDFNRRKSEHKKHCYMENDKHYNLKLYKFIRENGGWENWEMVSIKAEGCENTLDAKRKEREYIEQIHPSLNLNIPSRTNQEYYNDNHGKILEYGKKYYIDNKPRIDERNKAYNEKYKEYFQAKHKQYREENKEEKKITDKEYYEKHKDEICERIRQQRKDDPEKFKERDKQAYQRKKSMRQRPYECVCGVICKFSSRLSHFQSLKHQQYIQSSQQDNPQE